MMNHTHFEDAINKVMEGLRGTRAPEGMERRILQRLAENTTPRTQPGWKSAWWVMLFRSPSGWVLASVVAAVLLAVLTPVLIRRHDPPFVLPAKNWSPITPLTPAAYAAGTRGAELTHAVLRESGARNAGGLTTVAVTKEDREAALSMERMLAPSQPAPPLPLTVQERLLLNRESHSDPLLLAACDRNMQDQHSARLEAEFSDFFKSSFGPARTQDYEPPKTETDEPQKTVGPPKAETVKPATTKTA